MLIEIKNDVRDTIDHLHEALGFMSEGDCNFFKSVMEFSEKTGGKITDKQYEYLVKIYNKIGEDFKNQQKLF